jgi:hypothetical protein
VATGEAIAPAQHQEGGEQGHSEQQQQQQQEQEQQQQELCGGLHAPSPDQPLPLAASTDGAGEVVTLLEPAGLRRVLRTVWVHPPNGLNRDTLRVVALPGEGVEGLRVVGFDLWTGALLLYRVQL